MPTAPTLQPRLAPRPIGEIRNIFLSATVKDLGRERDAVENALQHIQVAVFLQDCWNRPAGDVVLMCLHHMEQCSGYLGIFGFRYGWIPENSEQSITELESLWAQHRWSGLASPPVFFFRPEPGSRAADELLKNAEATLAAEFPDNPSQWDLSKVRQRQFVARLGYPQHNVISFSEISELQIRAVAAISLANHTILKEALRADHAAVPEIPLDQLGAIGRELQMGFLNRALLAREDHPGVAAMCAVVEGPLQMGVRQFLAYLARWEKWEVERPIEPGAPGRAYDVSALIHWAYRLIAPGRAQLSVGFDTLADTIIVELRHEAVVLVLSFVDGLAGGLEAFHCDFWLPLYAALQQRWKPRQDSYRFSMVVATAVEQPSDRDLWNTGDDPDGFDYERLIRLPPLGPLKRDDIVAWLDQKKLRRARSVEIAKLAEKAEPLSVYEALQVAGVWKEILERSS
jgi:hypothetical protein